MKRARREPTEEHPLGYQRVTYFYGMMVALLLFFVGGLFSIYEGWPPVGASGAAAQRTSVALLVLGIAIVLESISLWGALREIRKVQAGLAPSCGGSAKPVSRS